MINTAQSGGYITPNEKLVEGEARDQFFIGCYMPTMSSRLGCILYLHVTVYFAYMSLAPPLGLHILAIPIAHVYIFGFR